MKIRAIRAHAIAGPLTDLCLVKVETEEPELFGWGEASLPTKCGAVAAAVADLAGLLIGMDARDIERCWQRMYRHSYWRGGPILTSSISGIDCALWDIAGKLRGEPVWRLIGGRVRDSVRLYANIGLSWDPAEIAERAGAARNAGFDAVKFYPLPALNEIEGPCVARIVAAGCAAARDAMGGGDFALDFHGRCGPGAAIRIEAACRPYDPIWIEEPVAPENGSGMARCAARFEVPLAAGERLYTRWGFREAFEGGWLSVAQPDVANAGGISEMLRIAAMAELHGVGFAPHNPNGPVQEAASVHLAFACQPFTILEHRHDQVEAMRAIATQDWTRQGPRIEAPPMAPGLGVEVDEDRIAALVHTPAVFESFRPDGSVADW